MAKGMFLILIGLWVLLQTIAGDLPARLLSLRNAGGAPTLDSGDPRVNQQGKPDAKGQFGIQTNPNTNQKNLVPLIP